MESEKLVELLEKVDAEGIDQDRVEEAVKVPYQLLRLYANSGPVPGRIIKNLEKFLDEQSSRPNEN
jgi:hypothetical protein